MWCPLSIVTLFSLGLLQYSALAQEYHDRFGVFDLKTFSQPFEEFLKDFDKKYSNPEEKTERLANFAQNQRFIDDLTKKMPNTQFGVTKYTDWSDEEMDRVGMPMETFANAPAGESRSQSPPQHTRSKETRMVVDWRAKGVVGPVKDQGNCSSCWAFSAVASTESAFVISGRENSPGDYSVQELMDCETTSCGCNSGYPWEALKYIAKHGIEEEKEYPYEDKNATLQCRARDNDRKIDDVITFDSYDVSGREKFLEEKGPLAIVMVIDKSLYFYKGGIYHPVPCTNWHGGHAMTAVGHGFEDGQPYWLLKNSWGTQWGEDGYIKFFKGDNTCEIDFRWAAGPIINKK